MSTHKKNKATKPTTSSALGRPPARAPDVPATAPAPRPRHLAVGPQIAGAAAMADEIERASTYAEDFGRIAPPSAAVAELLRVAHEWSDEQARADAWQAYVKRQREAAWGIALGALAPLQSAYDHVAANDQRIAVQYPATASFFAARRAIAQRASATKRKNKKGKKPAQDAAPATADVPRAS